MAEKLAKTTRTTPADALKLLEDAWAYFQPEPAPVSGDEQPDLFQYANAA
ncbi:hypothetical protein ACFORG_04620 [Lutimaribacter marinistellae]|uniref:Uncharacterized protein n=1 Tax=Lutimaribacter marinistellae TaxID=1820329 RepID=A0ABV7TCX4_9RHOB